jgi:hypothetical protein
VVQKASVKLGLYRLWAGLLSGVSGYHPSISLNPSVGNVVVVRGGLDAAHCAGLLEGDTSDQVPKV